jgi:arsenate reductase-like glutaredoxin family protein
MGYYDKFSSESVKTLKELNDKLVKEEAKEIPNNAELLKLRQQILMKGLEMSVGFNIDNYNPYR